MPCSWLEHIIMPTIKGKISLDVHLLHPVAKTALRTFVFKPEGLREGTSSSSGYCATKLCLVAGALRTPDRMYKTGTSTNKC